MATTWRLALKLGLSFALAEVTWNTKPHKRADKDPQTLTLIIQTNGRFQR
jgi:hypothetical protein